jgi:membrane fusion protein (multidrug efflux system)
MASVLRQVATLVVLGGLGYGGWIGWERLSPAEAAAPAAAQGPRPVAVAAAQAKLGPIERTVFAVGSGIAFQRIDLKVVASGRVEAVEFEGGEAVEAGRALLRMAEDAARAALAEAEADLGEAEAAYGRAATLREGGRVAAASLDTAAAARARAEARLARARDDLANRTLRAPFAGVVGFPTVDVGAVVDADTVIASLDDLSSIRVDFRVPERFFGDVKLGSPVRAETTVWPDEVFRGEVIGLSRRVDPVSRSFEVRARIDNADYRLPSGVFLRVELVLDDRQAILAPEEAVTTRGDEASVYVVEGDIARRRLVTLGARQAGQVEVLAGLSAGEMVVTRGVQKLRDGAIVTLAPPAEAPTS